MSAHGAICISGGIRRVLSTALIPQYNTLINTSRGAEQSDNVFLIRNKVGDKVKSASKPKTKVRKAIVSPMMVRYWKCQPYESLIKDGKSKRYL